MAQIIINPFDNDRLKTRKVQSMLDDLGVLPADPGLRPTFLKSHRAAAALIDRALANAPLLARCSNVNNFATEANEKFSSAYALPNGAEPLIVLDFKNEVYESNGSAVALGDLVTENVAYGAFDPADVVAGVGLAPGDHVSLPTLTGDALALVLEGATAVFTFVHLNTDADTATGGPLLVEMIDFPDFNTYYTSQASSAPDVGSPPCFISDNVDTAGDASLSLGTHTAALTMIDGKISRSIDGNALVTINPAAAWTIAPNFLGMQVDNECVLEKIALYPAQPDADLPGLSALS